MNTMSSSPSTIDEKSSKFENNLKVALDALVFVQKHHLVSPQTKFNRVLFDDLTCKKFYHNLDEKTSPPKLEVDETKVGEKMESLLGDIVAEYGYYSNSIFSGFGLFAGPCTFSKSSREEEHNRINQMQELTLQNKIGSCEMQSWVVFNYLKKQKCSVPVEVFFLKNYDHMFVVIGRDLRTDSTQPEAWNKDAVICGAWENNVFPAGEFIAQMQLLVRSKSIFKTSCCEDTFKCQLVHSNRMECCDAVDHEKRSVKMKCV